MQKFAAEAAGVRGAATLGHRHDVDGLRAVAVLAILAFHLGLAGFAGGFVGVDIFFVISGYVILRSILPDLERGRFSLGDFYIRRLRRILPALVATLLATMVAGFVILSPSELNELAGSALATMAFGANFFFHDRTGYFASAAHTRPLLHMWSLGIEEQFYILVPLALAGLMRLRGIAAGWPLAVLAAGSFGYSLIAAHAIGDNHAFYMPMARFWEIAAGGCVAVVERRRGLLGKGADGVAVLGLLAIAAAVVLLDSDMGGQRLAVVAVAGTVAVIAAGAPRGSLVAATLASPLVVGIGRISYSIYLVHWPLIVFWRLWIARPLMPHEQVLILVLTVGLAAALSVLVETPLRSGSRQVGNRPALAAILAAGAVVAALGAALVLDRGAVWRMGPPAQEALAALHRAVADRPRCTPDRDWLARGFAVCRWNPQIEGTEFVIWGDSHAGALAPEVAAVLGEGGRKSGVLAVIPHCSPLSSVALEGQKFARNCAQFVDAVIQAIARDKPSVVVIAGRWALLASAVRAPGDGERSGRMVDLENAGAPIDLADALARTIARVRASGTTQVVLIGPVPEIDFDVPPTLVRSLQGIGRLPTVSRAAFDKRQEQVLHALSAMASGAGVSVVYPHAALCDAQTCAVTDGIRSLYMDDDHLSPFGSARVRALVESAIGRADKAQAAFGASLAAGPSQR